MIASVHLSYGAASALFIQKHLSLRFKRESRYFCAFFAGLASHMAVDAWPHWEYIQTGSKLWATLLVETLFVSWALLGASLGRSRLVAGIIFFGMVGGAVPDLSLMIWDKVFFWEPLLYFHFVTHIFHGILPFFTIGPVLQVILAGAAIIYVQLKSA